MKKDEGNELYKAKKYREAIQRYSEAISEYIYITCMCIKIV